MFARIPPHNPSLRFVLCLASLVFVTVCPIIARATTAETLYRNHCIDCHGHEIYLREDRKIKNLDELEGQVQRCELKLGLQWFEESVNDVAAYLNHRFYRFPR